ncbi:MAG TPA: NAD(P)-dependent oxidoreductase, partial [Roseiflexaceae bacterium]|nr:NAD(P)-dependent oxidoreductase [Roseiflexaceae bacterium]
MRILVTGATGKVGRRFIDQLLNDSADRSSIVRALCHNRMLEPAERLEVVQGSIANRSVVEQVMEDVTHVVHLATCKETPDQIMDVAVKGMFWLLETCRLSSTFTQFIMLGGDAGIGHFFYPRPSPVTETQPHSAYPGCYALSKVLEEVMLEQYYLQYDLNGCCLRAPWIMEKDDFKYQLSFGEDVFGGPRWRDLVGPERADEYIRTRTLPVMLDAAGAPMRRNFVHLDDLVAALLLAI